MPLKLYKPKGSAIYHYRGTVAGHRLRASTGTTDRNTAHKIASEAEQRIWDRGVHKKDLTFPKAVVLYLAAGKSDRFIAKLEDYWKDTKVSEINAGLIKQAAHELYPGCSGATKNRQVLTPMQSIINHCAEMGLCDHLKIRRLDFDTKIKKPATKEWIEGFAASASCPDVRCLATFMFATAARISEALAVEWTDIDFRSRRVLIKQSKLGNERLSHLPSDLFLALANLPRDRKPFWRPKTTYIDHWQRTIEAAGIEKLSFHSCRHGFATALEEAGVGLKTIARLGGWKSCQHLYETYLHGSEDLTLTERLFDKVDDEGSREPPRQPRVIKPKG